jgi:hypothetical protein
MAAWERRHLARGGRVLAGVYGCVLGLACSAFVILAGWVDRTGWAALGNAIPALIVISLSGVGAVGCGSMAMDRRLPAPMWLLGLLPALGTAVWIVLP